MRSLGSLVARKDERRICQCERDHFILTSSISSVNNQYIDATAADQLDEAYIDANAIDFSSRLMGTCS